MAQCKFPLSLFVLMTFMACAKKICLHRPLAAVNYNNVTPVNRGDTMPFNYVPYFSAIVADKLDSSEKWYCSLFGLKVTKRMSEPATGFRVVILESSNLLIELIENESSLSPKEMLANKPGGTIIKGLFKIGFHVADIDACLQHISTLNIPVGRIYKDSSGKRNFLISDPDGNMIQFFE